MWSLVKGNQRPLIAVANGRKILCFFSFHIGHRSTFDTTLISCTLRRMYAKASSVHCSTSPVKQKMALTSNVEINDMGIRDEVHPEKEIEKCIYLPPTCYTLSK